ncbi:MAG: PSD1 domain-containing protein [Verrucomicrobiales bacterium]|nr:PSD1 domain-containing protein [Verrucomicrobiales bacterium]
MIPPARVLPLLLCLVSIAGVVRAEDRLQFNRDIRPILSDACFHCHGPDEKERKGGLRLDLKEHAFQPGKSGAIPIVPGRPDDSEILVRVLLESADPDHMPPPKSGKSLTPAQKDTLRRWIEQGAEYQGHWAFITPDRPAIPTIEGHPHPVDAFLADRLRREGLALQPEADRATLLRRVSLDLTGLPPTLAELDAFERDTAPDAYEKAVDRLLASPHFGERMALEWLDLARYADSNGFQSDGSRQMWLWRDWLIGAYNRNLPFDRFTIEQLAGDLLPGATEDQIIATGFNRNHRLNGEGGRIQEEWFVETVIDRVETTGMTWMALTLNCARCHDHKYDPLTQREFYQLFAFFNSNQESGVLEGGDGKNTAPVLRVAGAAQKAELARLDAAVAAAEAEVKAAPTRVAAALAAWEAEQRQILARGDRAAVWQSAAGETAKSLGGATLTRQPDGSWLATGTNPPNDTYEIALPLPAGTFGGVRLEVLPDPALPNQSLGRGSNGNFVLSGVELTLRTPGQPDQPVPLARAVADYEQSGYGIAEILANAKVPGSKGPKGWAVDGNAADKRLPRRAMFLPATPVTVAAPAVLTVTLRHQAGFRDHNIGRFRLSLTTHDPALVQLDGGSGLPQPILAILATDPPARTAEQTRALETYYRGLPAHPLSRAQAALETAKASRKAVEEAIPSVMIMKEAAQPKDAFILTRGEYDKPTDKVTRGLPAVLPPLEKGEPLNRLGLARWLVSGEHPLTARVWINREWERLFGTGIVKTSENFGSQAEWPSHPELLDWLAVEFVSPTRLPAVQGRPATSWDMKAMIKFLVTSRAYRQSSATTPALVARDPENRLLARGPRFRLRGELVRDQALAAGGLLVPTLGGPSVRPYMPEGVWDETSRYGDLRGYQADTGDGLYRRTLYTIWKRTGAPPTLLLFDAPTREVCTPKRSRTNTPLQALALLNETTYVEAARALAQRMIREGGATAADRLAAGYRLATARRPDAATLQLLVQGYERRLTTFRAAPDSARAYISHGASRPDPALDPAELAAYTVSASILLNLDRVVTRD